MGTEPYRSQEHIAGPNNIDELRDQACKALGSKPPHPIIVPKAKAFGDSFLNFRAHYVAVRKFCEKEVQQGTKFDFDPANPPIQFSEQGKNNDGIGVFGYAQSFISPFTPSPLTYLDGTPIPIFDVPNRYTRTLLILGQLLGVHFSPEELNALPLPTRTNDGPLKNFDAEQVQRRAVDLAISPERSGRKQVIIVQAGSNKWKRFNDDQVAQLVQEAKAAHPNSYVTVVTDKVFNPDQNSKTIPGFGADTVVQTPDINEIGANFSLHNSLIVTTDTFLAWYAAGCQGLLPENNGTLPENTLINLYTLADPDHWHIPGSYEIKSPALEAAGKEGYLSHDGFIIGGEDVYRRYWIYGSDLKATPYTQPNDSARALQGIAQGDINEVIRAIKRILGDHRQRIPAAS